MTLHVHPWQCYSLCIVAAVILVLSCLGLITVVTWGKNLHHVPVACPHTTIMPVWCNSTDEKSKVCICLVWLTWSIDCNQPVYAPYKHLVATVVAFVVAVWVPCKILHYHYCCCSCCCCWSFEQYSYHYTVMLRRAIILCLEHRKCNDHERETVHVSVDRRINC